MSLSTTNTPAPEPCFWITATKPCGRQFRLKIKRDWLFAATLQHWPIKVNAPPVPAAAVCLAFDNMEPEFWKKLSRKVQVKIHRWLHHFAKQHRGVMITCTGTLHLDPDRTRAIQRQNCHQELVRLLPELRRVLNIAPSDTSNILELGRAWCRELKIHLETPPPPPSSEPLYTPEQIAEGKRIIEEMRGGGWLRSVRT